ncbi:MAG: hypothetical protein JWQ69_3950 [Pseudomonas sp.]|nr:hypothetical protein [Pseudomonas sp.]
MTVNPPTTSRLSCVLFASLFAVLIALTSVSALVATGEEVRASQRSPLSETHKTSAVFS